MEQQTPIPPKSRMKPREGQKRAIFPSLICSGTVYAVIYEVDNTKNRSEPLRGITHA